MNLSAMIRKRQHGNFATATVATFATFEWQKVRTVASVATVAVANPETVKTDNSKTCSRWLIHFADRESLEVAFTPDVDHAGALGPYPNAVAAEPMAEMSGNLLATFQADSAVDRNGSCTLPTISSTDDRRLCTQCLNLSGRVCNIAGPGKLVSARQGYQPMRDVLHRCAGYQPKTTDTDQRTGSERWPGLIEMKGKE
ncbi:MAG: hypothetical protein PHV02_12035 [Rhodocyclaceae bacterium]|nr:hypothetical protein [Rhodocyclaceae bacterium]